MNRNTLVATLALAALAIMPASADKAGPKGSAPVAGLPPEGGRIYANICQSCHMANAMGATGAATIPALAKDIRLEGHDYPLSIVLYGYGAMPAMGGLLSDQDIAAVLSYVRRNFGNHYNDPVQASEVAAARVPGRQYAGGE